MTVSTKPSRLLPYLLILSIFFLMSHLVIYAMIANGINLISQLINAHAVHIPALVIWQQIGFVVTLIAVYLLFGVLVWLLARLIGVALSMQWNKVWRLGLYLWFIAALAVIFINQTYFPGSAVAVMSVVLVPTFLAPILMGIFVSIFLLCGVVGLFGLLRLMGRGKRVLNVSVLIVVAAAGFLFFELNQPAMAAPVASKNPNVIIIGIDSLRPDYTAMGGDHSKPAMTPFLNTQLAGAMNFTNAYTPLARTFPSWVAILTGLYPKHDHVRFNLSDQTHWHRLQASLGAILQQQGYYTVYATDDRHFSHVGKLFGFNQVIGPREGASDFVLANVNDFPLVNVLMKIKVGQWLFPYSYANRSSVVNYMPAQFNEDVEQHLLQDRHRPFFIAIHFCLPHFPYVWGGEVFDSKRFPGGLYADSVRRADLQVKNFMGFLKKHHFLDHAVVVFLSDHGEALKMHGDRLIAKKNFVKGPKSDPNIFKRLQVYQLVENYPFDSSYGHGSDVLSLSQYCVLMSFRFYGLSVKNVSGTNGVPAMTMDIKSTLLALLNIHAKKTDGVSLLPYILGKLNQGHVRARFVETGFLPNFKRAEDSSIISKGVISGGAKYFAIHPDGELYFKSTAAKLVLPYKQRAIYDGHWALALYPQGLHWTDVLVNLKTGQWSDDLHSRFARRSPVKQLIKKMRFFYGKEVAI